MARTTKLHRWQVTCSDGTTFEAQVAATKADDRPAIHRALVLILGDFRTESRDIIKIERMEEVRP